MLKEEKTTTSWWLFMPLLSWLSVASFHLLMRPRHRDNFIMVDGRPAAFVPRISDSWDNFILRQKMKLFYLNQMKRNMLFNFSTISSVLSFVNDWTHASTLSCRLRGPTVWKIKTSFHSWFFFSLSQLIFFLFLLGFSFGGSSVEQRRPALSRIVTVRRTKSQTQSLSRYPPLTFGAVRMKDGKFDYHFLFILSELASLTRFWGIEEEMRYCSLQPKRSYTWTLRGNCSSWWKFERTRLKNWLDTFKCQLDQTMNYKWTLVFQVKT